VQDEMRSPLGFSQILNVHS